MSKPRNHGKPKGVLKDLPIDQVVRLPELQFRAGGTDPDHVEALAEVVRNPRARKLPRVQVRFVDGRGYLLTDGFHTAEAYLKAGRKTVPANVLRGTWHDALADALKANVQHDRAGKRRTNADKRRAAEGALAAFPSWSDALVAEHCGVSRPFVGELRKSLKTQPPAEARPETLPVAPREEGTRLGADGRTYKVREVPAEAPWRAVPLADFLDAPDYVLAALKLAKVETAGGLFDAIAGGARFGLKDTTVRDLLHEVRGLDGFDGRLSEAADRPGPRPGAEAFNWKHCDGPFGAVVRSVNAVADHYPGFKDSTEFQGLHRLLGEFRSLWEAAQKRLTNKKEAA